LAQLNHDKAKVPDRFLLNIRFVGQKANILFLFDVNALHPSENVSNWAHRINVGYLSKFGLHTLHTSSHYVTPKTLSI
jgi:hypothetical protein